jgi:hypothetical protein
MSSITTLPTLSFENAGQAVLLSGVATLGQVFSPGELLPGGGLVALAGGVAHAVQLDVLSRHPDGSVKMAVLAVERPELAPGQSLALQLAPAAAPAAPPIDLAAALAPHSFTAALQIHGGATHQIDVLAALTQAIAAGTASFWQQGSLATQARVEIALEGSQRLVFDVTAYGGGGFSVDAQFNNDRAMEAQGGTVSFNLAVTMNGRTVMQESVTQAQYQNIQRSFSSTDRDGGQGTGSPQAGWLNIQQDIAHLQATGAVATYDLGLTIDASLLHNMAQATQSDGWGDTLSANGVTQDMYATGGRGDIGITTLGNTAWLISQDPHAAAFALGQAQAAGAVPWNMWNAQAGTWLNTDAYPRLWLDGRGGTGTAGDPASGGLTQQMSGSTGWAPDVAHQPDLSFVPFLLTGERWMLDNLQAQAAWNVMIAWPAVRHDAADLLVNEGQVRGSAWALRQLDEAAWISPDGSPAQAYFQAVSHENWAWLVSKIPEWTAMQGEAHGWLPGAYGIDGALAPWQQDYFASTTIAAARHGNADALTFLKWQENFLVGRFLAADEGFNPRDGMAYLLASDDPATGRIYTTWEEIGARTIARGWSNGEGWDRTSDGNYAQLGLATLAGIWEVTGSPQARLAYEALLALNPPHTSAATFARDPNYALAPPSTTTPNSVEPSTTTPGSTGPGTTLPPIAPDTTLPPENPVDLAITLGADSWQGDPIAVVTLDGRVVFQGAVSAPHATGGTTIALGQVDSLAPHQLSVRFTNDAWGGTADTDRNLHVEAILVNGTATGQHASLMSAGTASFTIAPVSTAPAAPVPVPAPEPEPVPAPQPVPAPTPIPAGVPLTITLGADSWQGDPIAVVTVNGQMVFNGIISAQHAAGGQILQLGLVDPGKLHQVSVQFTNDAWGGTATTDRNLYIEGIHINGVSTGKSQVLMSAGTANFTVDGATLPPPVAPAPEPTPAPVPAPVPVPPPTPALDVLKIALSGDAWKGAPKFVILVDGVQQGSEGSVTAKHRLGEPRSSSSPATSPMTSTW